LKKNNIHITYKYFFLFLFFSCLQNNNFTYAGNPQDEYHNNSIEPYSFDEDSLDFYRKQLKYPALPKDTERPEEREKDDEWERIEQWDEERTGKRQEESRRQETTQEYDFSSNSLGEFWVTLAKVLLFLLLALLVGYIIYKVSEHKKPSSKTKKTTRQNREIELEEIRENLHETDLQRLIRQAVSSGDYQHAISLYYLEVLKKLSEKDLIFWRKAKTNAEYLREVSKLDIAPQFRRLTHIFESIFYGEQEISPAEFQNLQALFENMLETVDKTKALNG